MVASRRSKRVSSAPKSTLRRKPKVASDIHPSLKSAYEKLRRAIHTDFSVITGPPSVGKKTIALRIFEEYDDLKYAFIDCYSMTTPGKFYSKICSELQANIGIKDNLKYKVKFPDKNKPIASHEFKRYYMEYVKIAEGNNIRRLYVILDHVEDFKKTNLMSCFAALASIRKLNIIVITYETPQDIVHYVTRISKTAGIRIQDRITPIVVPTWSKSDTIDWILSFPPRVECDLYKKYVNSVVNIAYNNDNKNPLQTLSFCQDYFGAYLDYYQKNLDSGSSLIVAFLRSIKETIAIRKDQKAKWTSSDVEIKLPANTAILIIAAYIAAYTRPADDKKNFVKLQKKTKMSDSKCDHISRPFTFERLYHLFKALQRMRLAEDADYEIAENGFIQGDVERLENLGILIHISGWSVHPDARYRLSPCVKYDYVERLATNNEVHLDSLQGLRSLNG